MTDADDRLDRICNSLHGEPVPMVTRAEYDRLQKYVTRALAAHERGDPAWAHELLIEAKNCVPTKDTRHGVANDLCKSLWHQSDSSAAACSQCGESWKLA